ncbi:MAG: DUF485 domain-containing protein [Nitrosomonadales bacterium]|nr:DUF485 domain-containing protein [Nitrosomonadales bacterium]MBT3917937.1 DUF485 domain-containing protein [Nitrosomonadales bacterium]MBT4183254.1 DUF485 domain-containing protein [Nitrosomonadales bacterium]MBT5573159.1 DUF485 domain-containing protein [Nitrosomonadales bacterium]MBT6014440.1 DUF485 domain-containing protein [Nitrosomonadales bacterium]
MKIICPLLFLTIAPYFCFIGVIAFKPKIFSALIVNTHISLGIFLGLFLIFLIFLITLLYVHFANKYIEPEIRAINNNA